MTLEWNGQKVYNKTTLAIARAIDYTAVQCVRTAKPNTPVVTSTLQGSIKMKGAKITRSGVRGLWGSFKPEYALYVERRRKMLTNATEKHYPKLYIRIIQEINKIRDKP